MLRLILPLVLALLVALPARAGETRYVSDEVFIPLHSGPGNQYRWLGKLTPGTRLNLLNTSGDGNWSEVATSHGTSGWVSSDYLTAAAPAQIQLPAAEARAEKLAASNAKLTAELEALQVEHDKLGDRLAATDGQLGDVSQQLAALKQISGKAVQLDSDNRELVEQSENLRSKVEMLEAENLRLTDKLQSEDFLNGALAVLLGVVITLVVPRLWPKRRRVSEWA